MSDQKGRAYIVRDSMFFTLFFMPVVILSLAMMFWLMSKLTAGHSYGYWAIIPMMICAYTLDFAKRPFIVSIKMQEGAVFIRRPFKQTKVIILSECSDIKSRIYLGDITDMKFIRIGFFFKDGSYEIVDFENHASNIRRLMADLKQYPVFQETDDT